MAWPTDGGSGIRTTLVLDAGTQHAVAVFFTEVSDVRAAGLEDS
jgi:hypothetical protein